MYYEGTIYRPPSESRSLLIQVTVGCSWNKCTFCDMYKDKTFRVRPLEEIVEDLREGAVYGKQIRRIFLCDGDVLILKTPMLVDILTEIKRLYPELEGVRLYSSAGGVLQKTPEELKQLQELGLEMVFIGLETGSDALLAEVNKGCTKEMMITAAKMLKAAGIKQSISIIAGLGGEEGSVEHMRETADALNQMQPEYVGMLVLYLGAETQMYSQLQAGKFRLPSAEQVLKEMHLLLGDLELNDCFFSSAHASNYLDVRGHLPEDKPGMIKLLEQYL